MADNYLENRMAEHMAGGRNNRSRTAHPSSAALRLGRRRVLVAGTSPAAGTIAAEFATAGCPAALLGGGHAVGARCFPPDADPAAAIDTLIHDWHEIDILILAGEAQGIERTLHERRHLIPEPLRSTFRRTIAIGTECDCPEAITLSISGPCDTEAIAPALARLCLYFCSPGSELLLGTHIPLTTQQR